MKYKILLNDIYAGNILSILNKNDASFEWNYTQNSIFGKIKIHAHFNNDLIIDKLKYEILNMNIPYVYNVELKNIKEYYEYSINDETFITYRPIIIQEMLFLYSNIKWIEESIVYDIKNNNFELINIKKLSNKAIILAPIYYTVTLDNYSNVESINNCHTGLKISLDKNEL